MQTKRFFLILGLILALGKILPAQVSSNSYSMEISGKPIYNMVTGESIRYLVVAYPSYILIDREGKLKHYYDGSDLSRLRQDIKIQFSQK